MYKALQKKRASILLALAVLAACSRNPAKYKAAFLSGGEKYAKEGKYQEAVIQFRNAIEIDPRFAEAHHQLALAYIKLKNSQLAYRELLTATELDPNNLDAKLELTALLLAAHRYDDAQKAAEGII